MCKEFDMNGGITWSTVAGRAERQQVISSESIPGALQQITDLFSKSPSGL
jgi:hypothetical protein